MTSYWTNGGYRRYLIAELLGDENGTDKVTIDYARVSSHDQKDDLKRQERLRELFCCEKGYSFKL